MLIKLVASIIYNQNYFTKKDWRKASKRRTTGDQVENGKKEDSQETWRMRRWIWMGQSGIELDDLKGLMWKKMDLEQ